MTVADFDSDRSLQGRQIDIRNTVHHHDHPGTPPRTPPCLGDHVHDHVHTVTVQCDICEIAYKAETETCIMVHGELHCRT